MKESSEQSEQLREVIRAAYRQGEEAVIGLVENRHGSKKAVLR